MKTVFAAVCIVACVDNSAAMSLTDVMDGSDRSKLMRKEARDEAERKSGDLVEVQEHRQRGYMANFPFQAMSSAACDDIYPTGLMNRTACSEKNITYLNILSREMCEEAAKVNGHGIERPAEGYPDDTFEIPSTFYKKRPEGCFKAPCRRGNGDCYFYNGVGDPSVINDPKGEAVCVEYKYLDGRATTSGTGISCNGGYAPILDEDLCLEAAECLGQCTGHEFRVGQQNITEYLNYPVGCFKHPGLMTDDGKYCIFFNPPNRNITGNPLPTAPKGTPICDIAYRRQETLDKIASNPATHAPTPPPPASQ